MRSQGADICEAPGHTLHAGSDSQEPWIEPLLWPFLCKTVASHITGATEEIQDLPEPSAAHSPAALNTNQAHSDTS